MLIDFTVDHISNISNLVAAVELHVIEVRKDSDINSVDDLLGKTVSIGEEESGSELNAKQILSAYGLNSKMVKEKNLNYADAAKQLQNGEIDAAFFTLGLNATVVEELSKQCDIKLIGIDDAAVKKLKNTYSYVDCKIPKNTYNGQSDEVGTVADCERQTFSRTGEEAYTACL